MLPVLDTVVAVSASSYISGTSQHQPAHFRLAPSRFNHHCVPFNPHPVFQYHSMTSKSSEREDIELIQEERPTKRARTEVSHIVPNIVQGAHPARTGKQVEDADESQEEELEALGGQTEPPRASDLYLDTVSSVTSLSSTRMTPEVRSTELYWISISKKCVRFPFRISTSTGALYAGSTSKAGDETHMHMRIPSMMTIMSSSILRQLRYVVSKKKHAVGHSGAFQVYVLPDGYPVSDPSLEDISFVLAPKFTKSTVASLSSPTHLSKPSYDLSSKPYIPGYIGLNDIKRNDYMNVIIHSLLHVAPLRDFLLLSDFRGKESELLKRFAGLSKKVWNPRLFKSQVSPHEFLQEVGRASGGKFSLERQGDPVEFLGWLLNRLHKDLGGTKKRGSSKWTDSSPACRAHVIPMKVLFARPSGASCEWKLSK